MNTPVVLVGAGESPATGFPSPMARLRDDIQGMHAYAVQDSTGMVKLDAMENPFTLPVPLQQALGERLGTVAINRYPGQRVADLAHALRQQAALPEGFDLMLGNGSDELISLLAMAVDRPGASILAPLPGFVMYEMSAKLQGLAFVGVDLVGDFELDSDAMVLALAQHQPALVYLAFPNNPTANLWSEAAMTAVVEQAARTGTLVVIDEAYQPFASRSWLPHMRRYQHVLVLRTLSKFGLAGVRIGYLMGPTALIEQINKARPPYNISVLNAECALFALAHADAFATQAQQICQQRTELLAALAQMPGLQPYPSDANMILVRVNRLGNSPADPNLADLVFARLKQHSVLVKNVSKMYPMLNNCLRLTVGTPAENQQMLAALKASL